VIRPQEAQPPALKSSAGQFGRDASSFRNQFRLVDSSAENVDLELMLRLRGIA
jgi:hypothetical protein